MNIKRMKKIVEAIKARKKILIIILIVITVGLLVKRVTSKNDKTDTTQIKRGSVSEELILSGEIKADEHTQLAFQSSGQISWVGVTEGGWVEKGQALARLDTTKTSLDLQIADATLRARAAILNTVYDDLKDKEDSESFEEIETRTTAETNKDTAVFGHIKAQKDLSNATLASPFAGVVTMVANPFSGVNVLFSQTQFEIVNPETIYFEVAADQSEVVDLVEGQKVKVVLDSFSDEELEGKIQYISYTPKADEVGTVYKVKVTFMDEPDANRLRVGMTGDASFILSSKENVLYAPPSYVNSDTSGKYVNLGKKNNKVYVEVGLEGEDQVEIEGDIKEGDTIYD